MKILVCGGRNFKDVEFIRNWLDEFSKTNDISHVIHGACKGVDRIAHTWCHERGIHPVACEALWESMGNAAGPIRNMSMIMLEPDLVVAFPGGAGTKSMTDLARNAGIKVIEIAKLFPEKV